MNSHWNAFIRDWERNIFHFRFCRNRRKKKRRRKRYKNQDSSTHPFPGFIIQNTGDINCAGHILHSKSTAYVTARNLVSNTRGCETKKNGFCDSLKNWISRSFFFLFMWIVNYLATFLCFSFRILQKLSSMNSEKYTFDERKIYSNRKPWKRRNSKKIQNILHSYRIVIARKRCEICLHSSWSLAVTVRTVCWMSSFSSTSAS